MENPLLITERNIYQGKYTDLCWDKIYPAISRKTRGLLSTSQTSSSSYAESTDSQNILSQYIPIGIQS